MSLGKCGLPMMSIMFTEQARPSIRQRASARPREPAAQMTDAIPS